MDVCATAFLTPGSGIRPHPPPPAPVTLTRPRAQSGYLASSRSEPSEGPGRAPGKRAGDSLKPVTSELRQGGADLFSQLKPTPESYRTSSESLVVSP